MSGAIPLDQARKRLRKGKDGEAASGDLPITVLGHGDGVLHFLDADGQYRMLTARQMASRSELVLLFVRHLAWLEKRFPKERIITKRVAGEIVEERIVEGFSVAATSDFLMAEASAAGLFGDHVVIRGPGIWMDDDGAPAINAGDEVMIDGEFVKSGRRIGNQVWAAAPKMARPSEACGPKVAARIQETMRDLWSFRHPGGELLAIGHICVASYGAAAQWRPNIFVTGGTGAGKSQFLGLMRACSPMHFYTNDTSKAGLEQGLNNRAMPIFVDEASDRVDQRGAQALLDLVLAASSGTGTVGYRGTPDGKVRRINVVGCIAMASISPPEMKPQHLGRFSMIELVQPMNGEDHKHQMKAASDDAAKAAASLWGRALDGWDRWQVALEAFRFALGRSGCAPREMDQIGALLAGWWVLTADGVPSDREALEGVSAVAEYVRRSDEVVADDSPQRVLQLLTSSLIQRERSTDVEQIGLLLEQALQPVAKDTINAEMDVREHAAKLLARYGIRTVRPDQLIDHRGVPIPRMADGAGIWLGRNVETLKALFRGSPFEGDRWLVELLRLESARKSPGSVRIGGYSGRAIWLSDAEFHFM